MIHIRKDRKLFMPKTRSETFEQIRPQKNFMKVYWYKSEGELVTRPFLIVKKFALALPYLAEDIKISLLTPPTSSISSLN